METWRDNHGVMSDEAPAHIATGRHSLRVTLTSKSFLMSPVAAGWRALRHIASLLRQLPSPARRAAIRRLLETPRARHTRLTDAAVTPIERLVVVCHGNIMRSAFAVAYLQQLAPELSNRFVGAGTHATLGRPAQESALRVSQELGVPLEAHRAKPLAQEALRDGDVIVCMDRANEANVMARYPAHAQRVFLIGDVAEQGNGDRVVVDPYARGDDATRVAFASIMAHAEGWLERLDRRA